MTYRDGRLFTSQTRAGGEKSPAPSTITEGGRCIRHPGVESDAGEARGLNVGRRT